MPQTALFPRCVYPVIITQIKHSFISDSVGHSMTVNIKSGVYRTQGRVSYNEETHPPQYNKTK